ncbi:hypothetical protein I0C86_36220 [Plantactinospora sp. S1510]|uniref:Peptidase n=1 Tax=Plantactinospora alkalitolerans TaxID=2789879 RepID=A0ABS0H8B8_9ACTN|nr:hypothetical protein [Plantactinospora alkalitolerans]
MGIRLVEAPVERREDPRAQRYIVDHLPPGTIIRRQVRVTNQTDARQRLELYPAAAILENERFQFGEGRTVNELSSWISLDRTSLDLGPGDEARVKVSIGVPPEASRGERYAVVWASVTSKPRPSGNVRQIHRTGIRLYLDVGLGGEPPSDFAIGKVTPARDKQGQPSVAIEVANTGERALDMTGEVTLSEGPAGTRAGPFEVVKGTTLAPGVSGTVLVRFPRDLANGPWKIDVALASGMVKRSGSSKITFPNPGEVGESSNLFGPLGTRWGLLGASLAVGLLLVVGLAVVARRSHRRRVGADTPR